DADLDAAVEGCVASKFRNSGQTCVCVNRIYVQSGVYEAFVERLTHRVNQLRVGDGFDPTTDLGPLITPAAVAKAQAHVAEALAGGASVCSAGVDVTAGLDGGSFMAPVVLRDVAAGALVATEETFGPVAAVMRFETEEEALKLANSSEFGLAAYAYTRDVGRALRVARGLEAGVVGINEGLVSTEVAPFGGIKASGLGREGSRHGLDDYVAIKYVCVGGV
ncbi:hypothetical protein HK405_001741, partial [Cladochytrium tenue]